MITYPLFKNSKKSIAKIVAMLLIFLFTGYVSVFSQPVDPKANVLGLTEGSIKKTELLTLEKITTNTKDITIVSFTLSYPIGVDDFAELMSTSDKLTDEMREDIKHLKIGTEVTFENIKAKRGDKTLILESITLKIKE